MTFVGRVQGSFEFTLLDIEPNFFRKDNPKIENTILILLQVGRQTHSSLSGPECTSRCTSEILCGKAAQTKKPTNS